MSGKKDVSLISLQRSQVESALLPDGSYYGEIKP